MNYGESNATLSQFHLIDKGVLSCIYLKVAICSSYFSLYGPQKTNFRGFSLVTIWVNAKINHEK